MKNSVLYTLYEYDAKMFVSVFCENKNRPQLKCNGKCFLAKMQKEQDKKDASNVLKQLQTEVVFYNPTILFQIVHHETGYTEILKPKAYYNQQYSFLYSAYTIKPPGVYA